jgi:hypothetical protein
MIDWLSEWLIDWLIGANADLAVFQTSSIDFLN